VRVLFFLVVSGAAHFLAARWIVGAFPSARTRRGKRIVYGVAAVLSSFLAIARVIGWKERGPRLHLTLAIGMIELSAVVIALAWLFVVVIAARLGTKVVATVKPPVDEAAREKLIGRRDAIERTVGITLATASTAALLGDRARASCVPARGSHRQDPELAEAARRLCHRAGV